MTFHSIISEYRVLNSYNSFQQLAGTLAAYFGFLWLAISQVEHWFVLIPAAAACGVTAVRLYMLQHDCMHRCFLEPRWLNDLVGVLLSPFTLTSFAVGRYNHNLHHSHVGDLDHRDTFEINVLTVEEYRELASWRKLVYRFYRSPFILIIVGPFLVYAVLHRFPKNTLKGWFLRDVLVHNLLFFGFYGLVYWSAGPVGVWVLLLSVWFGVSFGAIIPYVEHNFEDVHWGRRPELTPMIAALESSAVLDFGRVFHWITANIGFHDLHHLNPMIPNYNLRKCHERLEAEGHLHSRKISIREAVTCFGWKLWDEDQKKMVTFAAV